MTPAICVVGAGLIGRRHAAAIAASRGARLHSVADPAPQARALAEAEGWPFHPSLDEALAARPDGVILATPNTHHIEGALAVIAAGLPLLVEKPLATDLAGARAIVAAAEAAGVPLLTGHHRRHLPVIAKARAEIAEGRLGRIIAAHAMFWLSKPDSYFETPWRRQKGAGPILMNLIHDLDLLRWLIGDIAEVRAVEANRARGNEIEDAAAVLLTFANGALGTVSVSDAIVAPWSWELTARDNPAYPPTNENAYFIGGTHGALALPQGEVWSDGGARDWWQPVSRQTLLRDAADPLVAQVENFAAVISGIDEPVCSGREGLAALAALVAVKRSAETGRAERPES